MINLITGIVGVLVLAMFLGNYALTLGSVPLWIIIGGVTLMLFADFVLSLRKRNSGGSGDGG